MVLALLLLLHSHDCSHDLSGYVSQFSYIADGWQGDQKLVLGQQDIEVGS